jgi:hypothetical protein
VDRHRTCRDRDQRRALRLALALLDVQPTTAAGVASLFRYVTEAAEADESNFPDSVLWDDQDDSERGVDFATALLKVAADWLDAGDPRIDAAVAAVAALPVAAPAMADPIFAVLAEHREAMKAYLSAADASGRLEDHTLEGKAARAVTEAAVKREHAAQFAVLTAQPTTIAGVVALLDHVGQDGFLGEAPEGEGPDVFDETILSGWAHATEDYSHFKLAAQQLPGRLAVTMRSLIAAA